jgi:hypothetical protein
MENTDEKLYRAARKKVRRKRKFYSHLLSYLAVGVFLTFVNWFTRPGHWWVQWVWIGWGIGIFFHAISLYRRNILFGDDWEEQKIKEEMEKIKKR